MIKIAVCDEKNEAAVLTEKINEIFEKDETMIRMSYFKNASLLRYEVEDRVYFDLYILVIQQGQTEKEKQLMKTVRERDSEAFFLILAVKLESTLGIWRGNPRPFNDRDESAACFYHTINLLKA